MKTGMSRLVEVIGSAPSDNPTEFRERLSMERKRMVEAIQAFRTKNTPVKRTTRTKKKKIDTMTDVVKAFKETGVSIEQLQKFLASGGSKL